MDVSLDDYIAKSNFKIRIGNPNFKGGTNVKQTGGGFQTGKSKFALGHQSNEILDVSITVPAVQKTGLNIKRTNQLRDAKERLVGKNKSKDVRELLKQQTQKIKSVADARQKLQTLRAQKECPVDARAKIQSKKQGTQEQVADFTLTRTVTNKNNNIIQLTPCAQGNLNITKTLTKVMPPGYESLTGASFTTQTTKIHTKGPAHIPAGVKQQLGSALAPSSEVWSTLTPSSAIPKITRTLMNNISKTPSQPLINYFTQPQSAASPYPPPLAISQVPHIYVQQTNVPQVSYDGASSQQYLQPVNVPLYPYQTPPPTQQSPALVYFEPFHIQHQGFVQTQQLEQEVHVMNQTPVIPRIQVQNDQYKAPEPQYTQYAAPYPALYATNPCSYPLPQQQPMYYQTPKQEQHTQRAVPIQESSTPVSLSRTIVNNVLLSRTSVDQSAPLKRKLPVVRLHKVSNTGGPIKSTFNYIPIIDTHVPSAKTKLSRITEPEEPTAKKMKKDDSENVISPLQGYKISVTNLASTVTYDDIVELFGAIGAMKYARLVKQGMAEVVYVRKEDAINGTNIYNDRELDGLPMIVRMVTPVSAIIKEVPERLLPSVKSMDALPLQLSKQSVGIPKVPEKHVVDVSILHKALFKSVSSSSSKPVTFTVNI